MSKPRTTKNTNTAVTKTKIVEEEKLEKETTTMPLNRILSLSLRPKYLKDLVGQDDLVESIKTQLKSGRIPHFILLTGSPGKGKTTLARILALCFQTNRIDFDDLTEEDWTNYKKYDIREINAANKNGIDDIRALVETMRYKPIAPSKAKVVILDEAHQLTTASQNALITETEDVADHVYYIFCTSTPTKIIPALKRRAFVISPKGLTNQAIDELVDKAKIATNFEGNTETLKTSLKENDISSPGLVLQSVERYFSGMTIEESVLFTDDVNFDTLVACRLIASGNWPECSNIFKTIKKNDVYTIKVCVLGYLKAILLKSSGPKAIRISKAIECIASSSNEDSVALPSFLACVCLACDCLKTRTKIDKN